MPRSVRARIETRSARLRLSPRKEPYWKQLQQGVHAGYYRPQNTWWRRARVDGRYVIELFATADDHADADGQHVLNWVQAQAAVRAWAAKQTGAGPLTVDDVAATTSTICERVRVNALPRAQRVDFADTFATTRHSRNGASPT